MSNPSSSQSCGTLTVKPICADITDARLSDKYLRIFCKIVLGSEKLSTKPDQKNNKKPVWTSSHTFSRRPEDTLRIEFYHKSRFSKAKYIGECRIPSEIMVFVPELFGRCEILNAARVIGHLDLYVKWESENRTQANPADQAAFLNSYSFISESPEHNSFSSEGRQIDSSPQSNMPHVSRVVNMQTLARNFRQGVRSRIDELQTESEPEEKDVPEGERCVVCLGRRKAGVFYRCGHNCCCVPCGRAFIGSKCPICRQIVFDFIKIYQA